MRHASTVGVRTGEAIGEVVEEVVEEVGMLEEKLIRMHAASGEARGARLRIPRNAPARAFVAPQKAQVLGAAKKMYTIPGGVSRVLRHAKTVWNRPEGAWDQALQRPVAHTAQLDQHGGQKCWRREIGSEP